MLVAILFRLFGYVQTKVIMPGLRKYLRRIWARLRNTFTKDQFTQTDGPAQSSAEFNGRESVLTAESGGSSRQTDVSTKPSCAEETMSSAEFESGAESDESSRQTATRCATSHDAQFVSLECHY